jgi:hypothetical protein
MRRWLPRFGLLFLGVSALVAFFLLPIQPLVPALVANPQPDVQAYLDITTNWTGTGWAIPANCSNWHELYPNYCVNHHQSGYEDTNGDGVVSVCDNIIEVPYSLCWHIDQVFTTYFFSPVVGGSTSVGETPRPPGETPVCDNWHIISDYPPFSFCQSVHIDNWEDTNQNGVLDVCDNVQIGGIWYHIDKIGCDVKTSFNPATKAKPSSWGWLKSLFK